MRKIKFFDSKQLSQAGQDQNSMMDFSKDAGKKSLNNIMV